ncbi:MAG: hypothetical protein U9Q69_05120, partial [Nanoarchaeota archaeon]|nr:hypothetical protein [Nanoarchaeota archaeon]
MANNEDFGGDLARFKKRLENLEQNKLPKTFSNLKNDFNHIKKEIEGLSQGIDRLNELEKQTSKKLLQGDNLKDEIRAINKIKKEIGKKLDSFEFEKHSIKLSKRVTDLMFDFKKSEKKIYNLVSNKTKKFDSAKSHLMDIFDDTENKISLLKKKAADKEKVEELSHTVEGMNNQNRSFKKEFEGIDGSIRKLQKRINMLTGNKELEKIRADLDERQGKISNKIKDVEKGAWNELKKLGDSVECNESRLNDVSSKGEKKVLAVKEEIGRKIMPEIDKLSNKIKGLEQLSHTVEGMDSQNRSFKKEFEGIDGSIRKLQKRINLLASNKELEKIRSGLDERQGKISNKIKDVEKGAWNELKKLGDSVECNESRLNDVSS